MNKTPFALFDFDDTICKGDSIVPYVLFCAQKGFATRRHALLAAVRFASSLFGRCTVEEAKQYALSFLQGKTEAETTAIAHEFWQKRLKKRFFSGAVQEMQRLKDEGYHVLVVSASVTAYMDVLPSYLPADDVIATVCGMDGDGKYNGYLGDNCRGVQKPLRIAAYLAANHLLLDYEASRAYGDSPSDEPMLRLTAHPTLVNPSPKLRTAMPDAATVVWKVDRA